MRKLIVFAFALLASLSSQAEVWQARYGVAETFDFKLYNADGTLDVDEADGGTEVSLSCNEGAETTATNDFVDEGTFYSITLTNGEMNCERITVVVAATTTEVFFIQTHSNASAMTPQSDSNITQFGGSAGTFASGVPAVNTIQFSGDATAADNAELAFDDTAGAVPWIGIVDQGTAQSAAATNIVIRSAAAFADNTLQGRTVCALGSTQGYWQCTTVSSNVLTGDTLTVPTWTVTPSGTITYKIWGTAAGTGSVNVTQVEGTDATDYFATLDDATLARLPASLVSGRIDASVGAMASGVITAAAGATGFVDADALASDAVAEIWSLTCTEPSAKPAWGSTNLQAWICWIGAWSRNEINQTSSSKALRNDADNANLVTCGVSDDGAGTFSVQECSP